MVSELLRGVRLSPTPTPEHLVKTQLFASSFLLLALSLMGAGCMPSPKEVAAQVSADTKSMLVEAIETAQTTNGWQTLDAANTALGGSGQRFKIPESSSTNSGVEVLSKWVDAVFAESNIVERPTGALVYGLSGKVLCSDPMSGTSTPPESCVTAIDKLGLRLKVTAGYDFTIQVGPQRLEPLVVQLRSKQSIAAIADLAAWQKTIDFVNSTNSPQVAQYANYALALTGRAELRLTRNGDHDFTLSQSNLDALSAVMTFNGQARSYSAAAKSPQYSIRLEGQAKRATVLVDVGPMQANVFASDYGAYLADAGVGSPIVIASAGYSGQLVVAEGAPWLFTKLGLGEGQSTVTTNGKQVLSVDLNATQGRHFDVSASPIKNGVRLEVSPGVDFKALTAFINLPELRAMGPFSNAATSVRLAAESGKPTIDVLHSDSTRSGLARLINGTLSLKSVDTSTQADTSRQFDACFDTSRHSGTDSSAFSMFQPVSCP